MSDLHFTTDTTTDGVRMRDFLVGDVPGTLRSPAAGTAGDPLVLVAHGGGRNRNEPPVTGRARLLLAAGFRVLALDAPGHGERPRTAYDEQEIADMRAAMATGAPVGPIVTRYNADLARRAVPEWQATLDALEAGSELDPGTPVGWFGLNLGTAIGVPLIAADPRITAAALGQFWPDTLLEAASRITVPIEFAVQWDDEHIPRDGALALFDAFASDRKTLHANAGRHMDLPRYEADSAVRFFTRNLRP